MRTCERPNTYAVESKAFLEGELELHEIGWIIAGVASAITTIITLAATYQHATHYYRPMQQRNCIRLLWLPFVSTWVYFGAYRWFRSFEYWELAGLIYEAFALQSFLNLLLGYLGEDEEDHVAFLRSSAKRGLPFPFGKIRIRPSKPYFLYALVFTCSQYCVVRPLLSLIAALCESYHVLCSGEFEPYWAASWLEAMNWFSMVIALFGGLCLFSMTKHLLKGKRAEAKFITMKLVVAVPFFQTFLLDWLERRHHIKATRYWTAENIREGVNSLVVCCEMVLFAGLSWWAFSPTDYRNMRAEGAGPTKPARAFVDAVNISDYYRDVHRSVLFAWRYFKNETGTSYQERFALYRIEEVQHLMIPRNDEPAVELTEKDAL